MKRQIHKLVQGSTDWDAFRTEHYGSSEAAAMLGLSKHTKRTELLHAKKTGIAREVSDFVQERIFANGHATEATARLLAEKIIGEELYPATMSWGKLSASLDGLTMEGDVAFEHKQYNAELFATVKAGQLPEEHWPQCQQALLVSDAKKLLFMCSDGTEENMAYVWVRPDADKAKALIAGWNQFTEDLAAFVPQAPAVEVVADPVMALPALTIQVNGSITLVDNLKAFGSKLREFVDGIDRAPVDDQGFANAEAAVKTLKTAEDALKAAEANALAQTASVDEMRRTVAAYADLARSTRLTLEKMVKARKEEIRAQIVQAGRLAFAEHLTGLNTRLGGTFMPKMEADFAGAVKSKRTLSSLRDAVDTELARAKIQANEIADQIQVNLNAYNDVKATHGFLFADLAALVHKAPDDFAAVVKLRIAEHDEKVRRQQEAERERIRAEEAARLEREAKAKADEEARKLRAESEAHKTVAEGAPIPSPSVADLKLAGSTVVVPLKQTAAKATRPSDAEILRVLSAHFVVSKATVIDWLCAMDLTELAEAELA